MRGNDTVMLSSFFVSRSDWPEDRLSARVEKKTSAREANGRKGSLLKFYSFY